MNKALLAAGALAVLAGGTHFVYARNLEQRATGGEPIGVLVAGKDVKAGEVLLEESLAVRRIPLAYVDERDVRSDRVADVKELPVQVSIKQGQVLQWSDFQARDSDEPRDLAERIEPGKRAMTISVNSESSFGGLLKPGHRVDILGTFAESRDATGSARTQVLLQNVTVLATGRQLAVKDDEKGSGFNTVTLSVNVEQGELLSFADQLGELSLVLRGYSDLAVIEGIPWKARDDIFTETSQKLVPLPKRSGDPIERLTVKK